VGLEGYVDSADKESVPWLRMGPLQGFPQLDESLTVSQIETRRVES